MKENVKNWDASDAIDLFEKNYRFQTMSGDHESNSSGLILGEREYNDTPLKYSNGSPILFSSLKSLDIDGGQHCGCEHDCCGCCFAWSIRSSYSKRLGVVIVIIGKSYNY